MGLLDDAKKLADKAQDLAADHKDQVKPAIDKVEDAAGGLAGGKYKDQVATAADKAEGYVDGLDKKD
jgi:uncharacterized protein YukE